MVCLNKYKIKKGTNIWLTKSYLQRFYTVKKPLWVKFCERLLNKNFTIFLYLSPNTNSVYLTIVKNSKILKVRYSDHAPNVANWIRSDVDLFVGPASKGLTSEREVLNAIFTFFG